MEDFTRSVLILLSVIFSVAGDTVHLTMVTPTPYGAGSSSASISCFRSSPDDDVTLSFARPFPIDLTGSPIQTSTTLPAGSSQSVNGQRVTQYLTSSNTATGLFYCEGSSRGLTTRVHSIIHSVNRRFEPVDGLVTRTFNAGEGVTLTVTSVNSGHTPLWRRIRNGTVTSFISYNGFYTVTFPSSDVSDGDLFTNIQSALSLGDSHFSMIRVIVRGCAAGKWGPPDCAGVCDWCYNGGVCDDETGDCICPPGFMGPNCLTACGMHRFGWGCEFQCGTAGNVIHSCTGSQFGLPDPYGNSCISGYHGTHCNAVCSTGSFGAGCTQTCHCESGQCNAYTGQCTGSSSGCQAGWSGTNCQNPGSTAEPTTRSDMIPPTTQPPRATTTARPTPADQSGTAVIAVIVVVVVVVAAAVLCIYFLRCRKSRSRQPTKTQPAGGQEMTTYENEISPDNAIGSADYERVGNDQPTAYEEVGVDLPSSTYEDVGLPSWAQSWIIPFKNMIVSDKILGKGNFGEVRGGAVMVGEDVSKAAIKTLKGNASESDRQNFMQEFRTLTKVGRHPNIVGILGACQHEDILYVALEFMPNGDLRTYLRNARSLGDDEQSTLSSEKLIQFAADVAKGMQHLAEVGVIHRDLAARNILLDGNLVAKVSDFGLSGGEDIYVKMSRTRVPTRWLSLESLTSQTYTSKSDVWSFGILLWENATLGATPYENIKSKDLLSKLKSGYRMPKPDNCHDAIYTLMLMCWQDDPANRPDFKKLVTRLTNMADNPNHTYMRLLPKADNYMYLMIRPELDDN